MKLARKRVQPQETSAGRVRLPDVYQMKSEEEILRLVKPIYADLPADPNELVRVVPWYGGWLNALRFCVVRADGATTWITRKDIDQGHQAGLVAALRSFAYPAAQHGGASDKQHAVSHDARHVTREA
jgi:hypothetical protein